jgi:hypothetical protein
MPRSEPAFPAPMLRLIATLLLIWHLALALDYLNARFLWDPSLPSLTAALMLPQVWATVGWGLAIWLGLAASAFVAARDDAGVLMLFAAAVGAALAGAGDLMAGGVQPIAGLPRWAALAVLVAVPLAGWLYARARHASGHLT